MERKEHGSASAEWWTAEADLADYRGFISGVLPRWS
jgi:hypothetical protein